MSGLETAGVVGAIGGTCRTDLSGEWLVTLDAEASWRNALLHAPGTPVKAIPASPPSGGWDSLKDGKSVNVPGTTDALSPNWHGVSWWSRRIDLPHCVGATIRFEGARLLAEVYLDGVLIGYDLEGYTPFEVPIPPSLVTAGTHRLDVRITNPGGSDSWDDIRPVDWGGRLLPSSQDFGGLWLPVTLVVHHGALIEDIAVAPDADCRVACVEVDCTLSQPGTLRLELFDPQGVICGDAVFDLKPGRRSASYRFEVEDPSLYGPASPHRYRVEAHLDMSGACDQRMVDFGFRSFTVDSNGFVLNRRHSFLTTAISWGLYTNGPVPTPDEIRQEIDAMEAFGLTALVAHRRCAHPDLIDALEERGFLLIQEPGGLPSLRGAMGAGPWRQDDNSAFAHALMELRIRRLAKRDRSRAALIWWNLSNECNDPVGKGPGPLGITLLKALKAEDPSRRITWTSAWTTSPTHDPSDGPSVDAFDFHEVTNFPPLWTHQTAVEIGALAGPDARPVFAGESQTYTSLGALMQETAAETAPDATRLAAWGTELADELTKADPDAALGGLASVVAATAAVQAQGVARMVLHHRANPSVAGVAINGWHMHPRIGQMGLTRLDRAPVVAPTTLRTALAPLKVLLRGLRAAVATGPSIAEIMLIDEHGVLESQSTVSLVIILRGPNGCSSRSEVTRCLKGTGRVRMAGTLEIGLSVPGDWTIEVTTPGEQPIEGDIWMIRAHAPADLGSQALQVHDPFGTLEPALSKMGARVESWRMFADGPTLVEGGNLRLLHLLLGAKAKGRAAFLLRVDDPRARSAQGGLADLASHGLADTVSLIRLQGDWLGGWGFNRPSHVLPSLGAQGIWDHRNADVFPMFMIAGLKSEVLTGGITFRDCGSFSTGRPCIGTTTTILKYGEREVLLSTLPVGDALQRSPLALGLLADIARWLCTTQSSERISR